jgi:scyllo-inositol 2-dehydrogenase (NAD+)
MNKVRIAVLGLGRLGYIHAKKLASNNDVQLICVVDALEERAEKVARELNAAKWSIDPSDVFDDPDIDAVIIATPTGTHAELIKSAARSGKHIFVEKPVTRTLEEADEVIRVIQEYRVYCMVGFMRRFDPAFADAKKRIESGEIGKPLLFKGITRDNPIGKYSISAPVEFIKHSGGIFLDLAIHDYDMARFLIGSEVTSVAAKGGVLLHPFIEEYQDADQASTYLQFASGAAGDIESSRNSPYGFDLRCEIIGTEGAIQIGAFRNHDLTILTSKGNQDIIPIFPDRLLDFYALEMAHFIKCLKNNERPSCTEIDGKAALEIAISATESFRTGREVKLKS